jgi:formylglycine-generating enzyme required for sulfatase activity
VGRGTPNGYGMLDPGTVVHEWCLDWYDAHYYASSPSLDPRGPENGERRSSRGGSWRHHVRWSPPAARSSLPPTFRYADYGFRVLLEVE